MNTIFEFVKKFNIIIISLFIILFCVFLGKFIPIDYKIKIFTASHLLKTILMFLIPILIFPFVVHSTVEMKEKGAYLVFLILILVFISNFFSICFSYGLGTKIIPFLNIPREVLKMNITKETIEPIFGISLNSIGITETMILGIAVGIICSYANFKKANAFFASYYNLSRSFLEKVFIPLLPIYMLGAILKITHEIDFPALLPIFGDMIAIIFIIQITYISFLFFVGSGGSISKTIGAIRTSIPAGIVGFSTMSSLTTMPITLKAAEKNTQDPKVSKITISTTVNCHDIGECISLPMIALMIIYMNTMSFPDFWTYISFAFFVSLAQFSSVSVPGGSIIIMLPFLIQYLGFNDEMSSVIIAISLCTDPMGTANNVLGNSAFVIIISKLQKKLHLTKRVM